MDRWWGLAATLILMVAACGAPSDDDCDPGTEACECLQGDVCASGLTCGDGVCVAEPGGFEGDAGLRDVTSDGYIADAEGADIGAPDTVPLDTAQADGAASDARPDAIADATQDTAADSGVVTLNACGGVATLRLEGLEAQPGDVCPDACGGVVVCEGPDALRCAGGTPFNACGGCLPIPGQPDETCGPCNDGIWTCIDGGSIECTGASEPNRCGGCGALAGDGIPAFVCSTEGGLGAYFCTSESSVECRLGGANACGGDASLDSPPGTPCGACGLGRTVCDDADANAVVCDESDVTLNACGGCSELAGTPGEACGACGTWTCDGTDPERVVCVEERNACGGCAALDPPPGATCDDGAYHCDGADAVVCGEAGANLCGGSEVLLEEPGMPCGACGDGFVQCASPDATVCMGASQLNACDGCGLLPGNPGEICGDGARWACSVAGALVCDAATRNACGGEGPLEAEGVDGAELLAPCGECDDGVLVCATENRLACVGAVTRQRELWEDRDGDGFGDPTRVSFACPGPGLADNNGDCDDTDEEVFSVNACGVCAPEVSNPVGSSCGDCSSWQCSDGGDVECVDGAMELYDDFDGDTYGEADSRSLRCPSETTVSRGGDCDDRDDSVYEGAVEVPGDGTDQDCDGFELCYVDADDDGARIDETTPGNLACSAANLEPASSPLDCDDTRPAIRPGAPELIGNRFDDNCDGLELCPVDEDTDGFATSETYLDVDPLCGGRFECGADGRAECVRDGEGEPPPDCGPCVTFLDCDDGDATRYPFATELDDGIDQDCDRDEIEWGLFDSDGDGFTPGYGTRGDPRPDCDDAVRSVYPGAPEVAGNGQDDDCNGREVCVNDLDHDGFTDETTYTSTDPLCGGSTWCATCALPDCTTCIESGDCDDASDVRFPGAEEVDDGVDDDCNGDSVEVERFDDDGDGYTPGFGSNGDSTPDCNDDLTYVAPNVAEACGNGRDDNCNGEIDEAPCIDGFCEGVPDCLADCADSACRAACLLDTPCDRCAVESFVYDRVCAAEASRLTACGGSFSCRTFPRVPTDDLYSETNWQLSCYDAHPDCEDEVQAAIDCLADAFGEGEGIDTFLTCSEELVGRDSEAILRGLRLGEIEPPIQVTGYVTALVLPLADLPSGYVVQAGSEAAFIEATPEEIALLGVTRPREGARGDVHDRLQMMIREVTVEDNGLIVHDADIAHLGSETVSTRATYSVALNAYEIPRFYFFEEGSVPLDGPAEVGPLYTVYPTAHFRLLVPNELRDVIRHAEEEWEFSGMCGVLNGVVWSDGEFRDPETTTVMITDYVHLTETGSRCSPGTAPFEYDDRSCAPTRTLPDASTTLYGHFYDPANTYNPSGCGQHNSWFRFDELSGARYTISVEAGGVDWETSTHSRPRVGFYATECSADHLTCSDDAGVLVYEPTGAPDEDPVFFVSGDRELGFVMHIRRDDTIP